MQAGVEWVLVPLPWIKLGDKRLQVTLHGHGFEVSTRSVPGYHWWRVGVKLSRTFQPRVGICNHTLYRGIVHRTALAFGVGGFYAMRMPHSPTYEPPLSSGG